MLKNYMQRASKWHTHSPYLQLETYKNHCQATVTIKLKQLTTARGNHLALRSPVELNPVSLSVRSRSHECDSTISYQKSGFVT